MLQEENDIKPDFEKAELDLLREGLKRSYTERFKMMMTLMKIDNVLKKAKITHKPLAVTDKKLTQKNS